VCDEVKLKNTDTRCGHAKRYMDARRDFLIHTGIEYICNMLC